MPSPFESSVRDRLQRGLHQAVARVGSANGCIHLVAEDAQRIVCQAVTSDYRATLLSAGLDLSDCPAVHDALREGKPVAIGKAGDDPRVAPVARDVYGLRACLYTPIVDRRTARSFGVMIFSNPHEHDWSDAQRAWAMEEARSLAPLAAARPVPHWPSLAEEDALRFHLTVDPDVVAVVSAEGQVHEHPDFLQLPGRGVPRPSLGELLATPRRGEELQRAMERVLRGAAGRAAVVLTVDGEGHRVILRAIHLRDRARPAGVVVHVSSLLDLAADAVGGDRHRHSWAAGRVAARVAHELNNLLQDLACTVEQVEDQERPAEAVVDAARRAVGRGVRLSRELVAFAGTSGKPEESDLAGLLQRLRPVLAASAGADRRFELQAESEPRCRVEVEPMTIALLHLVANAREATEVDGTIVVRGRPVADDGYVVEVQDDGVGMPADVQGRATEAFFSTKPKGNAVGLGLTLARYAAELHGGRLEIESEAGGGTRVRMVLSCSRGSWVEGSHRSPPQRVLVVEDEPGFRRWVDRVLRREGFEIRLASSVTEALDILGADPAWPDAVVLDMNLPDGSGRDVWLELQRLGSRARVVVMTGYAGSAELQPLVDAGCSVLAKPLRAEDLYDALTACAPVHALAE